MSTHMHIKCTYTRAHVDTQVPMYTHAHVDTYFYRYTWIHIFAHIHACTCSHAHRDAHVHMHTFVHNTCTWTHKCLHAHTCTQEYTCTHKCVCTDMYICAHVHIYTGIRLLCMLLFISMLFILVSEFKNYSCICVHDVCAGITCHAIGMEVRGQFYGLGSLCGNSTRLPGFRQKHTSLLSFLVSPAFSLLKVSNSPTQQVFIFPDIYPLFSFLPLSTKSLHSILSKSESNPGPDFASGGLVSKVHTNWCSLFSLFSWRWPHFLDLCPYRASCSVYHLHSCKEEVKLNLEDWFPLNIWGCGIS